MIITDTLSQDLTVFIAREGDMLVTDSRAVALAFGKRHKNVMRTIDRMMRSGRSVIAQHARLNFEPTMYAVPGPKGASRTEPMYRMTAKGMSELAMSFSGDAAREVRIRFLNAFEEVSARLASAERSLIQRLHDLELKEAPSKAKGQIGSKLMNERRREKQEFADEQALLLERMQPSLLAN